MKKVLALLLVLFLVAPPSSLAVVAFDAFSSTAEFTADTSWSHAGGTPRGLVCWIIAADNIDEEATMTYGGAALTEYNDTPFVYDMAEDAAIYFFYKLSGIASGTQTVAVTTTVDVELKLAGCVTVSASADTEIVDLDASIGTDLTDPSVTLSLGGRSSFAAIGFFSGHNSTANTTPLSNWTSRMETVYSDAGHLAGIYTYNTIGTADVTAGWTQTITRAAMVAIAISEVVATLPPQGSSVGVGR